MENPFKKLFGKSSASEVEFDNRGKTIQRDKSGRIVGTVDLERYFGVFESAVSERNLIHLFNEISEIQFPIRAIAERALNADLYLKDFNTDSIIWKNRQINKFITQPNELESFDKFFMMLIIYYLLHGDGYVYSHIPKSLRTLPRWEACDNYYVLPSDKIKTLLPDKLNLYSGARMEDTIKGYQLTDGGTKLIFRLKTFFISATSICRSAMKCLTAVAVCCRSNTLSATSWRFTKRAILSMSNAAHSGCWSAKRRTILEASG